MKSIILWCGISGILLLTGLLLGGCSKYEGGTEPSTPTISSAELEKAGGRGGNKVEVTLSLDLVGGPTLLNGKNDANAVDINGDIVLALDRSLAVTGCPVNGPSANWEAGLIAFLVTKTPRSGVLDIHYNKSGTPDFQGQVDNWTTVIGAYTYIFQMFGWTSKTHQERTDGSTLIQYRGASIEVFKRKGGKLVSREQCFGAYADYDVLVK